MSQLVEDGASGTNRYGSQSFPKRSPNLLFVGLLLAFAIIIINVQLILVGHDPDAIRVTAESLIAP
jgi:hypothetical protein